MRDLMRCMAYLGLLGAGGFGLGRALDKAKFRYEERPYRPFVWEKEGRLYERLGIRRWKEKLPDMSRIVPGLIPSKQMPRAMTAELARKMVQETCVAEYIHVLLCIVGVSCVRVWPGTGGWVMATLFLLGNLAYCAIQRYNRPKLVKILHRLEKRERDTTGWRKEYDEESIDIELQHRAGAQLLRAGDKGIF